MSKRDREGCPKIGVDRKRGDDEVFYPCCVDCKRGDDEVFFPGCDDVVPASMFRKHLDDKYGKFPYHYSHASAPRVSYDPEYVTEFGSEEPVYSDDIASDHHQFVGADVQEGSTFDVLSLLSKPCPCFASNHLVRITNGETDKSLVPVDDLKGKYIVLCCVFIPQLVDAYASNLLHHLSLLSHEMSAKRHDIEMVLVLKVRPRWSHHPRVATHFVTPFSCLAVPFHHHPRIDYICRALNMGCFPTGLLVDPNQVVVSDSLYFASVSGIDAFPFTDAHIRSDQSLIYKRPVSLERLLGHSFVYRTSETVATAGMNYYSMFEETSAAHLGHKLVGLYLYITGDDMPMLRNVYHQCQSKGLEFEVVVACLPFGEVARPMDLEVSMAAILKTMKLPWWVLPFNNSVFHRLHARSRLDISDRLFIVLPNGELMDPHGELVVRHFGVDAYPFTRETVIRKALDKLRPLTLESSLLGGCLYRRRDQISVADIHGKNVVLCLCPDGEIKSYFKLLYRNYSHLKAKDPDFEVVFACLDTHISQLGNCLLSFMPWLVYLRDPSKSEFVADDLHVWGMKTQKMVAFGKDGHIRSIAVEYLLRRDGPSAFPFESDLVYEIVEELEISNFMSDMVWSDKC